MLGEVRLAFKRKTSRITRNYFNNIYIGILSFVHGDLYNESTYIYIYVLSLYIHKQSSPLFCKPKKIDTAGKFR